MKNTESVKRNWGKAAKALAKQAYGRTERESMKAERVRNMAPSMWDE